jgi:hypothetical protein
MAVDYVDLGSMANGGPSNLGEAHPRPLDATNLDQGWRGLLGVFPSPFMD